MFKQTMKTIIYSWTPFSTVQYSTESKKLLVEGLLLSKMWYIISQWGGAGASQLTAGQRLQNKLARWITGQGRRTKMTSLLAELKWFSIREMARIQSIVQVWKIVHKNKPEIMKEKLQMNDELEFQIPQTRLQFTRNSFTIRAQMT